MTDIKETLKHESFERLNFYNSTSPFLIKENGKYYFFANPGHTSQSSS